jgi:hypothetical protein
LRISRSEVGSVDAKILELSPLDDAIGVVEKREGGKPEPAHLALTGPCSLMLPSFFRGTDLRHEEQIALTFRPSENIIKSPCKVDIR